MTMDYNKLSLKYLGIDTYNEPVIYMRKDCHICLSEGFEAQARVQVTLNNRELIATLNTIDSDMLHHNEASLSIYAWNFLSAKEYDVISITHPGINTMTPENKSSGNTKVFSLSNYKWKKHLHGLVQLTIAA